MLPNAVVPTEAMTTEANPAGIAPHKAAFPLSTIRPAWLRPVPQLAGTVALRRLDCRLSV